MILSKDFLPDFQCLFVVLKGEGEILCSAQIGIGNCHVVVGRCGILMVFTKDYLPDFQCLFIILKGEGEILRAAQIGIGICHVTVNCCCIGCFFCL